MKKFCIVLILLICFFSLPAAEKYVGDYDFIGYDGSIKAFTMREFCQNSLSLHVMGESFINEQIGDIKIFKQSITPLLIYLFDSYIYTPISHEEGHRSILTNAGIGSISCPRFNLDGAAYVAGVKDAELENLRDTDFATFIRLHTAGIESDSYMYRESLKHMIFEEDDKVLTMGKDKKYSIYFFDAAMRALSIMNYNIYGLVEYGYELMELPPLFSIDLEENELERDIVGHDVYGMIHHLYNPTAEYQRYLCFADLSEEEKDYSYRLGMRTYIHFLAPWLFNYDNFRLTDDFAFQISLDHSLSPFGDYFNEVVYLSIKDIDLTLYARQYQNKTFWFPAFGIGLYKWNILDWLTLSVDGHFWMEPENLSFETAVAVPGGAGEIQIGFKLPIKENTMIDGMGVNIGALYKTKGFLPSIESHDEHFRLTVGFSLTL